LDWQRTEFFSINPFERLTVTLAIFMNVVWWVTNGTSNQVIIQRYQCMSDSGAVRRSLLSSMVCDSAVTLLLCLTGVALVGFFLQFPERLGDPLTMIVDRPDDLFPRFIGRILPVGISGLVIAALFSAAMSSLDSGINSISTVLTVDFKSIVGRGCHTDRQLLTRAKMLGLAVGIVSIGLTYLIQFIPGRNLYEVLARAGIIMTPLPLLFFLAFFFRSTSTPAGAWAAIISGWVFAALFSYWQWIVGLFFDTGNFSIFLATPLALLCALLVGLLVSLMTRPNPANSAHSL
jgi:SSS family solute:Na+ symporter